MLTYQVKVLGYAAERGSVRQEVVGTKTYGTQKEVTKRDEYEAVDLTDISEKEEVTKKSKCIYEFPQDPEDIKEIISQEAPIKIAGMLKFISSDALVSNAEPPKGRRGISKPLNFWGVELNNINIIGEVKRSGFLQIHKNFKSEGSTLEYGDSVDFTADMTVWTPTEDYKNTEPVIQKIVKLMPLTPFGPFRHAHMVFVDKEKLVKHQQPSDADSDDFNSKFKNITLGREAKHGEKQ